MSSAGDSCAAYSEDGSSQAWPRLVLCLGVSEPVDLICTGCHGISAFLSLGQCLLMRGFVPPPCHRRPVTVSCRIPARHFYHACQLQPVCLLLSLLLPLLLLVSSWQRINTHRECGLLRWRCLSAV